MHVACTSFNGDNFYTKFLYFTNFQNSELLHEIVLFVLVINQTSLTVEMSFMGLSLHNRIPHFLLSLSFWLYRPFSGCSQLSELWNMLYTHPLPWTEVIYAIPTYIIHILYSCWSHPFSRYVYYVLVISIPSFCQTQKLLTSFWNSIEVYYMFCVIYNLGSYIISFAIKLFSKFNIFHLLVLVFCDYFGFYFYILYHFLFIYFKTLEE